MPAKSTKKTAARHNNNQVRLIGGDWRGRKLGFPNIPGLRPTGDRMRETLFNWLAPQIAGARVLDLFAGSGALGLEALSRGAARADFVEQHRDAARALTANLQLLGCDRAGVHCGDALDYLRRQPSRSVDLLFLDPPFEQQLHNPTLELLAQHQTLSPRALVYIESPLHEALVLPPEWRTLKDKTSGQVRFCLYEVAA